MTNARAGLSEVHGDDVESHGTPAASVLVDQSRGEPPEAALLQSVNAFLGGRLAASRFDLDDHHGPSVRCDGEKIGLVGAKHEIAGHQLVPAPPEPASGDTLSPGESLALDEPDVDLKNGILAIRNTKFGKSRFVPLDDSTRLALEDYVKRRDRLCQRPRTDAFLISERGTRLPGCSTRRTFAQLCSSIGLRTIATSSRSGRGPRLQDIRHSFATRRLIEWYRSGLDVKREMPKLSTYLGHISVESTYWYIEAVPELLQLATEYLSGDRGGSR